MIKKILIFDGNIFYWTKGDLHTDLGMVKEADILKKKKVVDTEDIRKTVCYALRKDKYHRVCDYYGLVWLHAKPVNIKGVIKRDGRKDH